LEGGERESELLSRNRPHKKRKGFSSNPTTGKASKEENGHARSSLSIRITRTKRRKQKKGGGTENRKGKKGGGASRSSNASKRVWAGEKGGAKERNGEMRSNLIGKEKG